MTNQKTHPQKKPKRTTNAKAGRKGRGQRASAARRWEKRQKEAAL